MLARRGGSAARQRLDQLVEVLLALERRLDRDALVAAVRTDVEDVGGEPGVAERRDADVAEEPAVGGAGRHRRDRRDAGPELLGELVDRGRKLLVDRRRLARRVARRE